MKRGLLIGDLIILAGVAALLLLVASARGACAAQGDSKEKNVRALDLLKNRPNGPTASQIDPAINLENLLQPGDDTNRFQPGRAATVTGFVAAVLPGGLESCNCHAKDLPHRDTHIVLVAALQDAKKTHRHVIVEVTPKFHKQLGQTADLRKLVGRRVTFTGWMFFDAEHKQNAFNTNPRGTNVWRATCWEIHPVTAIAPQSAIPGEKDVAEMRQLTKYGLRLVALQKFFGR